jgi:hypothetical protein
MAQVILQSSFQFGEVSELLNAQVASPIYYKAARMLRNVVVIPQGGVEKRFGTKFIDGISDGSDPVDYQDIKCTFFDSSDGNVYFLVFTPLLLHVYIQGVLQTSIVTTIDSNVIPYLNFAQAADYLVVVYPNHSPIIITPITASPYWNIDYAPVFINYPTYDFLRDYYNHYFGVVNDGTTTPITNAENIPGQVVNIVVSSTGSTSSADWISYFTGNGVGGLIFLAGGVVRIEGIGTSGTIPNVTYFSAKIVSPFDNNSNVFSGTGGQMRYFKGNDVVYTQSVFSDFFGWPEKVTFFQNRIWFGRTGYLPSGLWGSNYNGYSSTTFNFDDSEDLDTSAVSTIISGDKPVIIEDIVSYKTLVVLTNRGVYSTPIFSESAITPSNINFLNKQTADASDTVQSVILDNDVIFSIKGGNRIKNLTISGNVINYKTNTISVLAPHLIDNPRRMATFSNSPTKDGNWLFVVNDGSNRSGELAIYQNVPEQEITAWTLSTTDGYFRDVYSNDSLVYFLIEREINGVNWVYIEELDFDVYLDSRVLVTTFPSPTEITVASLAGKEVEIIIDGDPYGTILLESDGHANLPISATDVEVGLGFTPHVRPMPLNFPTQVGNSLYFPKSIQFVYVDYYETTGLQVNGNLIAPFNADLDTFDEIPPLKTGFTKVECFNGWDPRQNIDITQNTPRPFLLIGIGYVVTI